MALEAISAEWVSALASCVAAAGTLLGVIFAWQAYKGLKRQVEAQEQQLQAQLAAAPPIFQGVLRTEAGPLVNRHRDHRGPAFADHFILTFENIGGDTGSIDLWLFLSDGTRTQDRIDPMRVGEQRIIQLERAWTLEDPEWVPNNAEGETADAFVARMHAGTSRLPPVALVIDCQDWQLRFRRYWYDIPSFGDYGTRYGSPRNLRDVEVEESNISFNAPSIRDISEWGRNPRHVDLATSPNPVRRLPLRTAGRLSPRSAPSGTRVPRAVRQNRSGPVQ